MGGPQPAGEDWHDVLLDLLSGLHDTGLIYHEQDGDDDSHKCICNGAAAGCAGYGGAEGNSDITKATNTRVLQWAEAAEQVSRKASKQVEAKRKKKEQDPKLMPPPAPKRRRRNTSNIHPFDMTEGELEAMLK